MPWGIQRLNAKKSQPNPNIVFIKPLPGPTEATAQDFLERIAAQGLPIMREHHLYVMSLEEYEPNREFVGRNFNAGEVIQLVLKSPSTGRWLPFEYVQMVMMHELAHCKQMNHSRAFWAVRNGYASEMHKLWSESYTGEGIWGRGASLATGEWERDAVGGTEALPEHLCGGTFRTRSRKRKRKPVLTYQQRKERRIRRRFGDSGVALGADNETKVKLEKGRRVQAKPRVANSERGRQLRAAAALARFEKKEEEKPSVKNEDQGSETESGSDDEDEDESAPDVDSKDALDVDGSRLVDSKGRGMVKVCGDEDVHDTDVQSELNELRDVFRKGRTARKAPGNAPQRRQASSTNGAGNKDLDVRTSSNATTTKQMPLVAVKSEPNEDATASLDGILPPTLRSRAATAATCKSQDSNRIKQEENEEIITGSRAVSSSTPLQTRPAASGANSQPDWFSTGAASAERQTITCSACSFANAERSATCGMCANVLDPANTPGSWRCSNASCASGSYNNSSDCGVCGLCGKRRGNDTLRSSK
ncbi:hypothetical protein HIM_02490 [Hirsutella minnesotensis 3608]|nr:hypothetical protein HIM_02490 [Hirsutella minnesotensis 3608]